MTFIYSCFDFNESCSVRDQHNQRCFKTKCQRWNAKKCWVITVVYKVFPGLKDYVWIVSKPFLSNYKLKEIKPNTN